MWMNDPKNNQPSVTTTLVVVFAVGAFVASALHMFGVVTSTSNFMELFIATLGTYVTRRITFGGKTYGPEETKEIKE
jgi:uncharacterized membrane protein YeaQ/YmgE (transglycosylase-associated protein family)